MRTFIKLLYFKILYIINKRYRRFKKLDGLITNSLPNIYCVDIGASYYAHPKWGSLINSPNTKWIAIEPNEENLNYLKSWDFKSKVFSFTKGLSRDGGQKTLYKTNIDSGSSLLEPVLNLDMEHRFSEHSKSYFFPLEKISIETESLNSIFQQLNYNQEDPVLLKLDTQGTELRIIEGLHKKILKSIICIELENTFQVNPVMKGASHFYETMKFMYDNDFELLAMKPIPSNAKNHISQYKPNFYLNEADCLFIKKFSYIKKASLEIQLGMLGVYITYHFYEELNALGKLILNATPSIDKQLGLDLKKIINLTR